MSTDDDLPVRAACLRLRDLPARQRARVSTDAAGRARLLDALGAADVARGVVVVGTCSRLELYVSDHPSDQDPWPAVRRVLAEHLGVDVAMDGAWVHRRGAAAVAHLFRTVCGLDSPILGDAEIVGQVRQAFDESNEAAAIDPVLYELFRRAMQLGKWARHETSIGAGGVGIGSAVCDLVDDRRAAVGDRVLLLGAGEAAASILDGLERRGYSNITVINRSRSRAKALVSTSAVAKVRPMSRLADAVDRSDVVIGAVSAPVPILDERVLRRTSRARLVIDVGQPRCTALDVPGDVVLLDDLVDRPPAARLAAVPAVTHGCEEAVRSYAAWVALRGVDGALRGLYRDMDVMIGRVAAEFGAAGVDDVDRVLRRRLWAAMHPHIHELRRITTDLATAGAGRHAAIGEG